MLLDWAISLSIAPDRSAEILVVMSQPNDCQEIKCPIQYVVDLLGNKWSILLLRELFGGDKRTYELLAALPRISTKILTQRLRELEAQGLVERRIYPEIPPHVEYSLTSKGQQIQPVMLALHQLGTQWLSQDPCVCILLTDLPNRSDENLQELEERNVG